MDGADAAPGAPATAKKTMARVRPPPYTKGETLMGLMDDIVLAPDERLETECAPIENIDRDVKKLADRMLKTMYEAAAAPSTPPRSASTGDLTITWRRK